MRSTAGEHAHRADALEAQLAKRRRTTAWSVTGLAGLAFSMVALMLGLNQLPVAWERVGSVGLGLLFGLWLVALGVRWVQRLRAEARAAAEEKG